MVSLATIPGGRPDFRFGSGTLCPGRLAAVMLLLLVCGLMASGCRSATATTPPDGPPRAVADWFMDKQYVEADQTTSVLATVGPARDKIAAEVEAVQRMRKGGGAPPEMRAQRVYYEYAGRRERDGEGGAIEEHVYHVRVDHEVMRLRKEIVLALVEEETTWRIFSVRERDLPPEADEEADR